MLKEKLKDCLHPILYKILYGYLKPLNYNSPDEALLLTLLSKFSQIASFHRIRFKDHNIFYNLGLYCMSFMPAGAGKDKPIMDIESLTKDIRNYHDAAIEGFIAKQYEVQRQYITEKGLKGWEATNYRKENPIEYINLTNNGQGTSHGLHKHRLLMHSAKFGSSHFHCSEFIDFITNTSEQQNTFLSYVKVAYQHGCSAIGDIKGERSRKHIEGVPMTMLVHSSLGDIFEDDKLYNKFLSFWERGYNRRCIVCYPTNCEYIKRDIDEIKANILEAESCKQECIDLFNKFYSTINELSFTSETYGKTLTITTEAYDLFLKMGESYEEHSFKIKNDVLSSEIKNRHHRAMQVAGIYALLDGSLNVSTSHLSQAIKLIGLYAKQFESFFKEKDKINDSFGNLFEFFKANQGIQLSKRKIFEGKIRGMPKRNDKFTYEFDKIIGEMESYAAEEGCIFTITKNPMNKGSLYCLKVGASPLGSNVSTSVNYSSTSQSFKTEGGYIQSIAYGFSDKTIPFNEFHNVVYGSECYSFNQFHTGHRAGLNGKGCINMIILDIDNSFKKGVAETGVMTIEEAKVIMKDYMCLIVPTKSHQKGKPATETKQEQPPMDRYRIVIPLSKIIPDNMLKECTKAMIAKLGIKGCDTGAIDLARYFYPSTHGQELTWYSEGTTVMDLSMYHVEHKIEEKNPIKVIFQSDATINKKNVIPYNWHDYEFLKLGDKERCKCPMHDDGNASAFIARHENGSLYLHCSACDKTVFNR